ncbi:hypothetical protein SCOR_22205 [Sulfidibacter corallicola]|uniref:Uncharacterized protein n=1 Tax=Sulfidibacter corallicola TaxID=2818388 RepID=A0A8A4TUQ4_SULCO|nr:hypothetical protein [Sulfidibacter corallicola]QTD52868.1 hypothetical protein J3U87_10355 [Sulfidibacter corallicola]
MIEPGSLNNPSNTQSGRLNSNVSKSEGSSQNKGAGGSAATSDTFSASAPEEGAPVYTNAGTTNARATGDRAQLAAQRREAQSEVDAEEAERLTGESTGLISGDQQTASDAQAAGLNESRILELIA